MPRHVPQAALADPRFRGVVAEILAAVASLLDDGATEPEAAAFIREAVRMWAEHQVRSGGPVPSPAEREALAQAVYDQRYGLGPLAGYLRDPNVENVDVNGCDQVWITYATGERVAGPPVAASDEELLAMIRTWAARGGQTARDFSSAAPLVNVALTGGARLTATMSVTPRPCLSLRRHGHLDASLARLMQLGTVDADAGRLPGRRGPGPLQHHRHRRRERREDDHAARAGQRDPARRAAGHAGVGVRAVPARHRRSTPTSSRSRRGTPTPRAPAASACTTWSRTRCGTTRSGSWSARSGAARSCRCWRR